MALNPRNSRPGPDGLEKTSGGVYRQISDAEFDALRQLIRDETGISIGSGKRELVATRLARRLRGLNLSTYGEYVDYLLRHDPSGQECQEMVNCITTNKTDFFREQHHFDFLRERVFPALSARARTGGPRRLRIWSAGCSTGEEPYSIAMTICEHLGPRMSWDARILASDIDTGVLQTAAAGVYSEDRLSTMSRLWRDKYFEPRGAASWRVVPEARQLVTFRQINFNRQPWPIRATFDLIFCRNVIIYFDRDMQRQLLENFARFLAPDGYLILGHSENITWASDLYRPLGMTIYARSSKGVLSAPLQTGKTALLPGSSQPDRSTAHAPQAPKPTPAPPSTKPSKRTASSPPLATPLTARRGPDPVHTRNRHKRRAIVAGEIFASRDAIEVSTLLGSCVCACLYDPVVKAGGMNHFMLPEGGRDAAASACYGVHAMELLITELQKLGGERSRLLAKVFGGAHVLDGSPLGNRVGDSNADFVNSYLNTEGIPIVAQKVGGKCPLRVAMHTDTGKVFVREVEKGVPRLRRAEQKLAAHVTDQSRHADGPQITFF